MEPKQETHPGDNPFFRIAAANTLVDEILKRESPEDPSAVVSMSHDELEVIRQGLLAVSEIERAPGGSDAA